MDASPTSAKRKNLLVIPEVLINMPGQNNVSPVMHDQEAYLDPYYLQFSGEDRAR